MFEDEEVHKQFTELQAQLYKDQKTMNQLDHELRVLAGDKKRGLITSEQLKLHPEDRDTFQALGKMFIKKSKNDILTGIQTEISKLDQEAMSIDARMQYTHKSIVSTEASMKEILEKNK
eukprot:TRINITY_DN591_c0_g3_i1.p2 TRINITY_DN591_c0_g3~~TRINITY_DN591_c0_g3_i1.p2  ORF type:complete len:119 (+),score=45.07 TRINITY_DN591_c0_g3_i1:78-434(+)